MAQGRKPKTVKEYEDEAEEEFTERSAQKRTGSSGGRPLKNIYKRVGHPVRCLVTLPVLRAVETLHQHMKDHATPGHLELTVSDVHRLALYRLLDHYGLITPVMREEDDSFKALRDNGLV